MRIFRSRRSKSAWLYLGNPVTCASLTDEQYGQHLNELLISEPIDTLEQRLRKLLPTARFRRRLNTYSKSLEDIRPLRAFLETDEPSERGWILYSLLLEDAAPTINKFNTARQLIEKSVLLGLNEEALRHLEEMRAEIGESIWYVRQKILVLYQLGQVDAAEEFCEQCKQRAANGFVKYLITCLQVMLGTDNNAPLHWKNFVGSTVREFVEAGLVASAGFITLVCSPTPIISKTSILPSFRYLQVLPVVDLYTSILPILDELINAEAAERDGRAAIPARIRKLSAFITDEALSRFSSQPAMGSTLPLTEVDQELVNLYEAGKYDDVVSAFEKFPDRFDNPLGLSNMVAKALAYSGSGYQLSGKGMLFKIVNSLASIYRLDETSKQSQEDIISWIVKLHGLSFAPQLQLLLYVALPYRYTVSDAQRTARRAISYYPNSTPLVHQIAAGERLGMLDKSAATGNSNGSPEYRVLRRRICESIKSGADKDEITQNLERLEENPGLIKDFLEIYATHCLRIGEPSQMLPIAAKYLVRNYHTYLCMPLAEMVDVIERERISSLDSVIVAYHYLRYISDDRDYVLHECLEEYIATMNAVKPSEMLVEKSALTDRETFFYREVCVPEIIDFLSCFSSTDELRAERVLLLDLLLEVDALGADERMVEVENLVGQAIIDSDTSQLNGPKIFVDGAAIQKKVYEEVRSLYATYRQASDSDEPNDDRLTLLDQEFSPMEGGRSGYVSGNKNATLLSMRRAVRDAFLFDEKYGLDKNLSTEIRHGFFSNLMRSRLEENHLLTEVDSGEVVRSNEYWRGINSFFTDHINEEIDTVLYEFSKEFNQKISDAEEYMKIRGAASQKQGLSFETYAEEFMDVRKRVDLTESADEAISLMLDDLWAQVEQQISEVRDYLNVKFRKEVDDLFGSLEANLGEACNDAPRVEMTSSIRRVRADINEDITTASEWFRRTQASQLSERSFDNVVRVAVSSFEKVKGIAGKVALSIQDDVRWKSVPGDQVKPAIIAMINLLDNCFRHSGLGRETMVSITVATTDGGVSADVENNLSSERANLLNGEYLDGVNAKAKSTYAAKLMRAEGGSGVSKAYQQIATSRPGSDLILLRDNSKLIARIFYADRATIH